MAAGLISVNRDSPCANVLTGVIFFALHNPAPLRRRGRKECGHTMFDSFTREQLLASADGTLFGPDAGRLPSPPMLMFDRITRIDDDGGPHGLGQVHAELDIHPELWFFGCHF